jgi:hypothetical protein
VACRNGMGLRWGEQGDKARKQRRIPDRNARNLYPTIQSSCPRMDARHKRPMSASFPLLGGDKRVGLITDWREMPDARAAGEAQRPYKGKVPRFEILVPILTDIVHQK